MHGPCDCIDCQILRGEHLPIGGIIYQDDLWVLNHAAPKVLGHLILKPIVHYSSISDIPDELAMTMGPLFRKINHAIEQTCKPEKIYIAAFGDWFPYLHWHFYPRYHNMPAPASATMTEFDQGKYSCSAEEIIKTTEIIRWKLKAK